VISGILAGVLVATAVLGWVFLGGVFSPSNCGGPVLENPPTSTPIKHLFVIVKENHAFENYFGGLAGVTGNPPNGSFPLALNGSGSVQPFPLTGYSTDDFPHDVGSSVKDYNSGKNNLFVAVANAAGVGRPQDAVGYYGPAQLPGYYAYAKEYALGDHFFSGFLGPTFPNRVFDITAYAGSWGSDTPPPSIVAQQPTILDQLNHARIPWEYDWSFASLALAPTFFPSLDPNPCNSGQLDPVSGLGTQVAGPSSPSVVYIDPADDLVYSEHPPENVTVGEEWTVGLVNTIFSSPIANSSAVLIWFDESGGFWDPVPPPLTSTGRDGFRIPFLVLSPWTPVGKVCHQTIDPASVLQFIDQNWGLSYLNSRVAGATNLSCFFNFNSPARPPLFLPSPVTFPAGEGPTHHPAVSGLLPSGMNPFERSQVAVWRERPAPSEPFSVPIPSFSR